MLRPIDMTMTIQGASEAHRTGAQTARPEAMNQMFADSLEKKVKMQEQQVIQSNQSEKSEVQPDREGHGGGYNPKRKPAQKKPEPQKKSKPSGESLYDIMI